MPVARDPRLEQIEILIESPAVAESGEWIAPGDGCELLVEPFQLGSLFGQLAGGSDVTRDAAIRWA